jgi:hypothetical protein
MGWFPLESDYFKVCVAEMYNLLHRSIYFATDVNRGRLSLRWQRSFHDDDKIKRTEGHDVLALSAFTLSSLPTPLARKSIVKEMWESGANVMVGTYCVEQSH